MRSFKFRMPQEVTFGSGCSSTAAEKALQLGSKRPLFITGSHMAQSKHLAWLMEKSSELALEQGRTGTTGRAP